MGANMVRRLIRAGHQCVVYNRTQEKVQALAAEGAVPASSVEDFARKLAAPKTVWLMLPAGEPTESMVAQLLPLLCKGSAIVDGGNSFYKDDVRRGQTLEPRGINYVDAGISGGVWGLERGYCLMLGGSASVVERLQPALVSLAPGADGTAKTPGRLWSHSTAERGFLHCGPAGAGHFVKMVHNAIEYGLMESYAEGFHILHNANSPRLPEEFRYEFSLPDIAEVWRRGSVLTSWLLDLTAMALTENPTLSNFAGVVPDSGEARWTLQAALDETVPVEAISAALYARFRSRQPHTFAEKVLSAMRYKFGGHLEHAME
jgi:6-phosphogluconate dehydrogenase